MLNRAKLFAIDRHANQTYGGLPYVVHLAAVESVVTSFFGLEDVELRAAAWLHDVLEDTNTQRDELELEFGREVSDLVWAVTNAPGVTRAQRVSNTYPKIRQNDRAIALKLADRIANVEAIGKFEMYRKEHSDFKAALYNGEWQDMWDYLDALFLVDRVAL